MKQTEAQRLADDLGDFANEVELEYCVSDVPNTAALLLRQDELLRQALEVLELIVDGEDYGKIDGLITAIRAHREAK